MKSLGWMPKSLKILRSRPQTGDCEKLGKNLQNDLGSLPSRSTGFARPGCPVAVAGPKVGVLPSERTVPKGPKASRQKQNGVIITCFLTRIWDEQAKKTPIRKPFQSIQFSSVVNTNHSKKYRAGDTGDTKPVIPVKTGR